MATQTDWYNTFLASKSGRAVYFELRTILHTRFRVDGQVIAPQQALAQCVLDDLALMIEEYCGINTPDAEMKMIGYQAAVAAEALGPKNDKKADNDLHETH